MRKFWEVENLKLEGTVLRVSMVELTSAVDEISTPINVLGVVVTGRPLKVRASSERATITFSDVVEFRAVPEQLSWPAYEDGQELISCLLYKKEGPYFYGEDCPLDRETFGNGVGWVKAVDLQCYIIHSESLDLYVLSNQPPSVF